MVRDHTMFHAVRPVRAFGLVFDAPMFSSVDPGTLALAAAAVFAIFRLEAGMIETLAACSAGGIARHSAGVIAPG